MRTHPGALNEDRSCPDCDGLSRRDFLRGVGGAMAVTAAGVAVPASAAAQPAPLVAVPKPPETLVKVLHDTLTPAQRKVMHFPFDHELRSFISNNWDIVEPDVGAIGKLYTSDQKEIIREILRGSTTEDGFERFMRQMKDDGGGFENYTCALFGEPGTDAFEWVLTGRHATLRVDGNSVPGAAFGGPIFYGHAVTFNEKPDHPGNVWWHQSRLANDVFASLDGTQREKALLVDAPPDDEKTIRLKGHGRELAGLRGSELSADQKELLKKTLRSLLSMFRQSDVDEVLHCIERNGGLESLHLSFFKEEDLGGDGIWDRWLVEGPTFAWYFRGSPHVHVWVNVAASVGGDDAPRARL